ncbi:hypothetical protein Taro_034374 [Colocasia esculenta]|uniref:Uncharacterized protein n=1 Tax=Colocasia esculenta TaxID=4460 RepID=A0A843W3W4_COLES|nr:hypothetical protein [Colocasia esculenta]
MQTQAHTQAALQAQLEAQVIGACVSTTSKDIAKSDSEREIFKHFNIDLKGEVMEKMGQPIQSKNLKKSGFSLVGSVWSKTSMAEGEAIIGEVQEIPVVQKEEEAVRIEEPVTSARRIEEIASEHIEHVGQPSGVETPSTVIASVIEEVLETFAHIEGDQSTKAKEIAIVKAVLRGMRSELGSLKKSVTGLSDLVRAQLTTLAPLAPTHPVAEEPTGGPSGPVGVKESRQSRPIDEDVIRPPGPTVEESGPPGASVEVSRPSGPVVEEVGSGPSGPGQS